MVAERLPKIGTMAETPMLLLTRTLVVTSVVNSVVVPPQEGSVVTSHVASKFPT